MADENETGPCPWQTEEDCSAGRRSASTALLCERCGGPLSGKKQRWCSDACRMADRRDDRRRKQLGLLDTISAAVEELRNDVGGLND